MFDMAGSTTAAKPMPYLRPAARAASRRRFSSSSRPPPSRDLDGARIIAGIVKRAGGGAVREFSRRDEIAPDDVERIELKLHRDALHQPLQRQVKLRAAEAANEARRHFVGEHDAVDHVDIGDVVGAGDRAVHAVERARHRRAQERAVILELIEPQRRECGPSLVTAASISVTRLGPELAATRCSMRSSTHFTGRPVMRAASAINTT